MLKKLKMPPQQHAAATLVERVYIYRHCPGSCVPHFRKALEQGALTTLLDEFQPKPRTLNLVYAANRFLPIKVRAFLDFSAPRLKRVLADFRKVGIAVVSTGRQL